METQYAQGGRGKDPRWDMMMRMDVLENNIKSIDQASVDTVNWPTGHLRYLYGVEFLEYIAEKYGEDRLISLVHIYGDLFYIYGPDGPFIFVYEKTLNALWSEWLDDLRVKNAQQVKSFGDVTNPNILTNSGYYNLKPRWSRDGNYIFYQKRDADSYPGIQALDIKDKKDSKIFEGAVSTYNLSQMPDGQRLLFTKDDTYKNYYYFRDLYLLDMKRSKLTRLTRGERAGDADVSTDGSRIVFVKNVKGTQSLWTMKSDGSGQWIICTVEASAQYYSPRFSPDGKKIVFAKWRLGGEQKIYMIDLDGKVQARLTGEIGLTSEANPCYSPAGDYVFFDSDRSGVVNLYAYHLRSKRLYQVTNVVGGAMMPDVSPDGKKLAYVAYASRGYDIAVMDIDVKTWKEIGSKDKGVEAGIDARTKNVEVGASTDVIMSVHNYDPIPMLLPKFWLPIGYSNENGSQTYIFTLGQDILGQHTYETQLGYDFQAGKPQYSLFYANDQFVPQIAAAASDSSLLYGFQGSNLWMRHKESSLAFTFYNNRLAHEWDSLSFSAGLEQTNISNISSLDALPVKPSMGDINSIFFALNYYNSRQYRKSISPEDGFNASMAISQSSPALGSKYNFTNYSAKTTAYFPALFKHHVLTPALSTFYSKGDQLEQSNFTWKYLPIRGYPTTDMAGNKGLLLATEYRFPISYPEIGFLYGSTFFEKIWGKLFYDLGGATFDPLSNIKLKRSYGAEVILDTALVWNGVLAMKLGYVKGLDADGQEKY